MGVKFRRGMKLEKKWKIGDLVSRAIDGGGRRAQHWKIISKRLSERGVDARGRPYILYTLESIPTPGLTDAPWWKRTVVGVRKESIGAELVKAGSVERAHFAREGKRERAKATIITKPPSIGRRRRFRITPKTPRLRK